MPPAIAKIIFIDEFIAFAKIKLAEFILAFIFEPKFSTFIIFRVANG